MSKINTHTEIVKFRDIEETELNAQQMNDTDFRRLVKNIKKDGCLTSAPLIMKQENKNKYKCISGHHRIRAAIKAGVMESHCIITDEIDESTRIRLQLTHNDINGESDKEIISILQQNLNDIDIELIDKSDLDVLENTQEIEYSQPTFRYINICLLEESRESLIDIMESLSNSEDINWLIEKDQYEKVLDLLTIAFEKGFRTPGQAFGKFLEIIQNNKNLIER